MLKGFGSSGAGLLRGLRKTAGAIKYPFLGAFLFVALFPAFSKLLFIGMPGASAAFDCDDATLFMQDRLAQIGIASTAVGGNTEKPGGTYFDIDHVWLIADILGIRIPFDWGTPRLDRAHFQGIKLTRDQLLYFARQDRLLQSPSLPSAPN